MQTISSTARPLTLHVSCKGRRRDRKATAPKVPAKAPLTKAPMTKEAAAKLQSMEARQHGGKVEKGGLASWAQSAAAKKAPLSAPPPLLEAFSRPSVESYWEQVMDPNWDALFIKKR